MVVAVNEVGFSSPFFDMGRIWFQSLANHEPTMAVPRGPKMEIVEAELAPMLPNQPIQIQQKRWTSGRCPKPPWAVMLSSLTENPGYWPRRALMVVPYSPTVHGP